MLKKIISAAVCLPLLASAVRPLCAARADSAAPLPEEYLNVKDFGARGTDDRSDFEAIQSALNEALNAGDTVTVYIPEGNYFLDNTLRIYSNTHLLLDENARLIRSDESKYMLSNGIDPNGSDTDYNRSHDITVTGGVWDGNVNDTMLAKGLVKMWNAKDITFDNTIFTECCGTHFVLFNGVKDVNITNTEFCDFIPFSGSERQYTSQTKAKFNYRYCEALHIDFRSPQEDPAGIGVPCINVTVSGCRFSNVPAGVGTHHTYDEIDTQNVSIFDNTFENCAFYCVDASSFSSFAVYDNAASGCGGLIYAADSTGTVSGNTLNAVSEIKGSIYYHSKDTKFIHSAKLTKNSRVNMSNNSLSSSSGCGIAAVNGAYVNARGNTIINASINGILIQNCTDSDITENTINGCGENGILLKKNSKVGSIESNQIYNAGGHGIAASSSAIVSSKRNTVSNAGKHGVYLTSKSKADMRYEQISGCASSGFYASDHSSLTASDCLVSFCGANAFTIASGSNAGISDCSIYKNGGMDLRAASAAKNVVFKNNGSDKRKTKISKSCSVKVSALKKTLAGIRFEASLIDGEPLVSSKLKQDKDFTADVDGENILLKGIGDYRGTLVKILEN